MTTIISRLFPDLASAQRAVGRLSFRGIPRRSCKVISGADGAEARLRGAKVHDSAVNAYSAGLAAGNAVLVVHATYKPLGAAGLTRDVLARFETLDAGGAVEEHKLPWQPDHAPSVLKDHPLFLSLPGMMIDGPVTSSFGMRMTKPHRNHRPLSNKRASRAFWPMPLLSKKRRTSSVIHGGRQMSRMFWPMPLLSNGPRRKSVIPGGGLPFSRLFGFRTIS